MGVNTPCSTHVKFRDKWFKCRTVALGEEEVKEAGPVFLPTLAEQTGPEYDAYKLRALFYGATGRTVEGLTGAVFRKPPQIDLQDPKLNEELKSVTSDFLDHYAFTTQIVHELINPGRVGIMCDAPPEKKDENGVLLPIGKAFLTMYQTESIKNWKMIEGPNGMQLGLVVLEENYEKAGEDEFCCVVELQYRVLDIFNGVYRQRVFRKDNTKAVSSEGDTYSEDTTLTVFPKVGGSPLTEIPFKFLNPWDTTPTCYNPPLLPLANVNVSHYRSSADLEHGRHFTGLPTAWVAGFDKATVLRVGSQVAWISEDSAAHAGYLEFTGQGLTSLENALKEKQGMMAVLGARMLEDPKQAVESDKTLGTRYRGENSILASISRVASLALTEAYMMLMKWRQLERTFTYTLNTDFINDKLSAQDIKFLMETWQGGGMSWETLFFNYQRGEVYPEDVDMKEEKGRLENEVKLDPASFSTSELDTTKRVDGSLDNQHLSGKQDQKGGGTGEDNGQPQQQNQ